jgi:hypothetical protein
MRTVERARREAQVSSAPANSGSVQPSTPIPDFIEVLGLKSSSFLSYSLWFLAFGFAIRYLMPVLIRTMEREAERRERHASDEPVGFPKRPSSDDPKLALTAEARRWRQEIRFQQSFSSGWSGSLKLPIGLEGGVNEVISLAQMQLSLPEIVEGYRQFITLASTSYQVIIAIDELDKIESDEKAQQFLNEIKAIFGLERCFYLVSVSESALSSFERRGLPFRDAFDSAFDDMVNVDYLGHDAAKRLLLSRVIGLPIPFLTFCYCFSGGLARDLLRACRDLFQEAAKSGERELMLLIKSLAIADVRAKVRATIAHAVTVGSDPQLGSLLERLRIIDQGFVTGDVVDSCRQLLSKRSSVEAEVIRESHRAESVDDMRMAQNEPLLVLSTDLGVYTYYILTLVEVFGLFAAPDNWKTLENIDVFDGLASVRRYLSSNPLSAQLAISDVRVACELSIPEFAQTAQIPQIN